MPDVSAQLLTRSGFETPIGQLSIFTAGEGIVAIEFADQCRAEPRLQAQLPGLRICGGTMPRWVQSALERYFEFGRFGEYDRNLLRPLGTPFQQRVWSELVKIGVGSSVSYGEIARRIGRPTAARAVGAANGQNPIPLFIPCHRVVGSSGALTGYGSGLGRKAWLLRHEASCLPGGVGADEGELPLVMATTSQREA